MTTAQSIFLVYGVVALTYGFVLGIPLAASRMKAPHASRHLVTTHLAAIIQGAVHLGLVVAIGFADVSTGLAVAAAWLIVAVRYRRSVRREVARLPLQLAGRPTLDHRDPDRCLWCGPSTLTPLRRWLLAGPCTRRRGDVDFNVDVNERDCEWVQTRKKEATLVRRLLQRACEPS